MLTVEFIEPEKVLSWWIFYDDEDNPDLFWSTPIIHRGKPPGCDLSKVNIYTILEKACRDIRKHRLINAIW